MAARRMPTSMASPPARGSWEPLVAVLQAKPEMRDSNTQGGCDLLRQNLPVLRGESVVTWMGIWLGANGGPVANRIRSLKAAQVQQSQHLRAEGKTWVEIAGAFRTAYGVNARVAFRLAHGWSQRGAA